MRFITALALTATLANAQGLDFDKIFAKAPKYKTKPAVATTTVNKQAVASSIQSQLNAVKPHTATTLTVVKSKSTTKKTSTKPVVKAKSTSTKASSKPTSTSIKAATKSKSTSTKERLARNIASTTAASAATTTSGSSCAAQSILYSYVPSPNTPNGFLVDNSLANIASAALAPAGYTTNFTGQYGSLYANNYLGYYQLPSYDASQCSAICDSVSGCQAFNIYFERDPVLDPGVSCPNPTSATKIACALWGSQVSASQALNIGEWRNDFMVVIQGSNGYTKNTAPPAISKFTGPTALAGAINVNTINGANVFINSSFTAGPYDPTVCSAFCTSTTTKQKAAAIAAGSTSYSACNYFDAYAVSYNTSLLGTYCAAYTTSAVASYATQYSQQYNGVKYDITYSYGYAVSNPDSGIIASSFTTTTTTTTAASATTSAAVTPAVTNDFRILSAYFADTNITALARANFLVGSQLVINTTYPNNALGSDPWSDNTAKVISILYTYKGETRVFAALQNSGSYVQQAAAYTASNSPGSSLVTAYTPSTSPAINIAAVVWGTSQITTQSVLNTLYSDYSSHSSFGITDDFFGVDPNWGVVKSAIVWYYNSSKTLSALTGREYTTVSF